MVSRILLAVACALVWFCCGMQASISIDCKLLGDKVEFREFAARTVLCALCGILDLIMLVLGTR